MNMMSRFAVGGLLAAAVFATAPAQATQIPDGNVSVSVLFNPAVNFTSNTFTAASGLTFEISGTGGFAGATAGFGALNGVLDFSNVVGGTINQSIANFFTFADGTGHTFNFSVDSVKTVTYAKSGSDASASLYLLGETVDTFLGYSATKTSLTLGFNSTGGSPFAASATLAVPPAPLPTPEPATWAMSLIGFGAMGAMMRRRPRTSVSFA